jgi:hypothetical protein
VRGQKAEKACKAERANVRVNAFQSPAEHFGAHIDAERRLQCRTDIGARSAIVLGKDTREIALRRPLRGALLDLIND